MANSTGDRLGAGPHARPVPEQGALGHRRGMFSTLSLYVDRILHVSMPLETWEMYRSGGLGPVRTCTLGSYMYFLSTGFYHSETSANPVLSSNQLAASRTNGTLM